MSLKPLESGVAETHAASKLGTFHNPPGFYRKQVPAFYYYNGIHLRNDCASPRISKLNKYKYCPSGARHTIFRGKLTQLRGFFLTVQHRLRYVQPPETV